MTTYSILFGVNDAQYCAITKIPSEFPDELSPMQGDRLGDEYKEPVEFQMSKLVNPRGLQIADVIHNGVSFLMVSERMKVLLQGQIKREIEFLPFRLRNHKGRLEPATFYIVNVLGRIDCADRARSAGTPSPTDDEFLSCTKLALDAKKVPADADIFRTTLSPSYVFVRDDLRAKIEAAKLSARFVLAGEEM